MKKQLLLTRMLLLVALLVGSISAWGDTYTLVKNVSELSQGDVILITNGKAGSCYAMGTYSSGNNVPAKSITISEETISSLGEAQEITLESKNAGGNFTLKQSANNYFYAANSSSGKNNYLKTKNDNAVYWSITVNTTSYVAAITDETSNCNSRNKLRYNANTSNPGNPLFSCYSSADNNLFIFKKQEAVVVTSLTVKTAPTKTRYEVGESLDMTGFALDADGNTVTSGYTMTMSEAAITNGATLSSAGRKTLIVSYGGKTVNQPISVGSVTGIAVTTAPTKTSYDTGDSFDPTGMVVTASLSTGEVEDPDTWTKEVTGYTVDPEDDLAPANTYVTITYATKTATQNITVTDVAVTGVSVKASTTIEKSKTEDLSTTLVFTPANATNKNVSWESDDEDVATVTAAGVVTGVAAGTANITVTTEDGVKTATCVVTVVNKKGSIDAPYSVADVIAIAPSSKTEAAESDVYVIGYIVGGFNTSSNFTTTPSEFQASNLALADDYNETTGSKTIPVEMKTGTTIRTNYNPVDNTYKVGVAKVLIKADVIKYFGVPGLKSLDEMTTVAEAVKVSSAGYGTWASDNKLDFTGTSISAYKATVDGTEVNFTQVNVVPANSGILLYADGGASIEVPVTTADADVFTGNKLVRGTGASLTYAAGTAEYYILANETAGIGFYKANNNTVATNRAYLDLTNTNAKSFVLPGGETDGIRSIENSELRIENSNYYNLAGQRVGKDYKGIVIVNGKKMLNK